MSASQTVLVTGGAGYIGSIVTRDLLSRGYQVVAADALLFGGESLLDLLSHPAFTFSKTDITDAGQVEELFARHHFDAVVHLASIVGDPACKAQPELAERTIWEGSRNLFELCERHGVGRFIFASTCSNYGKMEGQEMLDEEAPLRPVSLYAELKVKFERYLLERSTPVDFTLLRFATVYGLSLRPRFDLTINEFVRDALLKGELEIYGPQFWRPYCHVSDIARAVVLVLETPARARGGQDLQRRLQRRELPEADDRRRGRQADPREGRPRWSGPKTRATTGSTSTASRRWASSRGCACPTASRRSPAPCATASSPIPTPPATGTREVAHR